jgi:VWFA-related protein
MSKKRRFRIALAVVLLLVPRADVWSQLRARVEEVVVPVNVRDATGSLVIGLTKDDFTVLEDGKPQTISSFSIEPVALSAAIVIDDGMSGTALKRLVPLLEVLTAGFTADDEMAAFRYDHFVWKLSDFTNDSAAIQKSFGELARISETRPAQGVPGEAMAGGPNWLRAIVGALSGGIGTVGAPSPIPSGADRPKPVPTSRLLHDAIYEAANLLRTRPADRRRFIFLVSDGQVTGANKRTLEQNTDFLLQNDIQVYAVATDFALLEGRFGALGSYATATGGDVYSGGSPRDMETAFGSITEQARNQYVLGYASTNRVTGVRGIYRQIDVKAKPPGVRVTHRRGYIQYPAN